MNTHPAPAHVSSFFDATTATFTHVVWDAPGGHAAVIDPVLGFEPATGHTSLAPLQPVLDCLRQQQLTLQWILETHAHADHLSAAPLLQRACGGRIAIGRHIQAVQAHFKRLWNLEPDLPTDGRPFDHLFDDGEAFTIGRLQASALHVPGHTPADMAYAIGEAVFVGDTLFAPDVGTARCDFPGGDAQALYRSARRLLSWPDSTLLYLCHDYPPTPRPPLAAVSVAMQRQANVHMHDGISEAQFMAMRRTRDASLAAPALVIPAIQVNIRAGRWPAPDSRGDVYLKQPIMAPSSAPIAAPDAPPPDASH